jgi:Protein of unknown function (DUF3828)
MIATLIASGSLPIAAQTPTPVSARISPAALVSDLYRQHNRNRGPFFQTKSRALLTKYFTKKLADLIWKDRIAAGNEVGALDGDPLYNAQDTKIKRFVQHKPTYVKGKAEIVVSFENFGKKETVTFLLVSEQDNWKIANIKYSDGTDLAGIFKAGAN